MQLLEGRQSQGKGQALGPVPRSGKGPARALMLWFSALGTGYEERQEAGPEFKSRLPPLWPVAGPGHSPAGTQGRSRELASSLWSPVDLSLPHVHMGDLRETA